MKTTKKKSASSVETFNRQLQATLGDITSNINKSLAAAKKTLAQLSQQSKKAEAAKRVAKNHRATAATQTKGAKPAAAKANKARVAKAKAAYDKAAKAADAIHASLEVCKNEVKSLTLAQNKYKKLAAVIKKFEQAHAKPARKVKKARAKKAAPVVSIAPAPFAEEQAA